METGAEPETETGAKPEAETGTETGAEAGTKAETETGAEPDVKMPLGCSLILLAEMAKITFPQKKIEPTNKPETRNESS